MAYVPTIKSKAKELYKEFLTNLQNSNEYVFRTESFMGKDYVIYKVPTNKLPMSSKDYLYDNIHDSKFFAVIGDSDVYLCTNRELIRNMRRELNNKKGGKD